MLHVLVGNADKHIHIGTEIIAGFKSCFKTGGKTACCAFVERSKSENIGPYRSCNIRNKVCFSYNHRDLHGKYRPGNDARYIKRRYFIDIKGKSESYPAFIQAGHIKKIRIRSAESMRYIVCAGKIKTDLQCRSIGTFKREKGSFRIFFYVGFGGLCFLFALFGFRLCRTEHFQAPQAVFGNPARFYRLFPFFVLERYGTRNRRHFRYVACGNKRALVVSKLFPYVPRESVAHAFERRIIVKDSDDNGADGRGRR